ncbi:TIGR02301 family protein [Pararhizobium sp. BT-229]|uniref:TIGR02301 family protein n=1 Tax=Pararhizobium sp. BT-229 TaxID=2986923 RepID=UPI0021F73A67|nr:TIGR02301 family protein [Pararhizobium sp. BT-229]MCV9965886.1 TIGR02301 family protein [Pararhizobium sp. BT-229]
MTRFLALRSFLLVALASLPLAARAQETPAAGVPAVTAEKPAPYDARLLRLAEILGSVHYLRTLCKDSAADSWRQSMQDLLDKEAGTEAQRRARMTAAFNRGYRTFASVYTACTPPAVVADERYRAEGATLASEITARFGN